MSIMDVVWTYVLRLVNKVKGYRFSVGRGARVALGSWVIGDIEIGDDAYVGPKCDIRGRVVIGKGTVLNGENYIRAGNDEKCMIIIGNYCAIAPRASIFARDHDLNAVPIQIKLRRKLGLGGGYRCEGKVVIGHDVWLGFDSLVLGNVKVGNGAVVAAKAVVTKDVPKYTVVAGVPAKPIGKRFSDEIVELIESTRWYEEDDPRKLRKLLEMLNEKIGKSSGDQTGQ